MKPINLNDPKLQWMIFIDIVLFCVMVAAFFIDRRYGFSLLAIYLMYLSYVLHRIL